MHTLIKYLLAAIIFTMLLISCSDSNTENIDSYLGFDIPKETFDHFLTDKMKEYEIPGLSIAVINDGKVVYHQTKGFANISEQIPVTAKTIFEGASISKSVFSFFVMTFVEEGILDLDKPLYTYMEYPDIAHDDRYKKITARMALSHRSGFPNWREHNEDGKLNIQFDPGTDYFYSGEGYQFVTQVLKHILKTDDAGLEAEFQERVGIPIGLEHTVYIQNDYTRKHKAEPYDKDTKWIDWKNNYWFKKEDGYFYAPASIHSESLDFSKWMIAVMNREVLTKESYNQLLKSHSKVPFDDFDVSYSLGFIIPNIPFTDIYLHGGNNEGFTSWFVLDTEKDWGFVVFTNSEYGEQLGQELLFYMLADPGRTKLYVILGLSFIFLILVIVFAIRWTIRSFRKPKNR